MKNIFDNLINGNLKDAKRLAKRRSYGDLRDYAIEVLGFSKIKAALAANYLKTGESFQDYCDAN